MRCCTVSTYDTYAVSDDLEKPFVNKFPNSGWMKCLSKNNWKRFSVVLHICVCVILYTKKYKTAVFSMFEILSTLIINRNYVEMHAFTHVFTLSFWHPAWRYLSEYYIIIFDLQNIKPVHQGIYNTLQYIKLARNKNMDKSQAYLPGVSLHIICKK